MPDVTVHPHGARWAIATSDTSSPVREFETKEAALSSARELAGGGSVDVLDEDPSTLGGSEDDRDPGAADTVKGPGGGLGDPDHTRAEQGGL
jgi:hypothetical protein